MQHNLKLVAACVLRACLVRHWIFNRVLFDRSSILITAEIAEPIATIYNDTIHACYRSSTSEYSSCLSIDR